MTEASGLRRHIPEPRFRPGGKTDFSYLRIPAAGAAPAPNLWRRPPRSGRFRKR